MRRLSRADRCRLIAHVDQVQAALDGLPESLYRKLYDAAAGMSLEEFCGHVKSRDSWESASEDRLAEAQDAVLDICRNLLLLGLASRLLRDTEPSGDEAQEHTPREA